MLLQKLKLQLLTDYKEVQMPGTVLKDIGLVKNRILPLLLNSDDIMEILLGKGYTQEQVWGADDNDDDYGIVYKQVFPHLYIGDTQTEVLSYLCFEVDVPRIPTETIKDMKIIIWAFCNKSSMRYSKKGYLGTKADILADAVERALSDSQKFGIGKLHLDSATYLSSSNKQFYGRQLIFTVPDFKLK